MYRFACVEGGGGGGCNAATNKSRTDSIDGKTGILLTTTYLYIHRVQLSWT